MAEISIQYDQVVSGTNRTLQNFDFLAQTLDQMIAAQDSDQFTLCELLKNYASSKKWALSPPIGQLVAPKEKS